MSAGSAIGYAIARFTGVCAATGDAIEPGDGYVAALIEPAPGEALERRDYTIAAWTSMERPSGLFACWRTQRKEREEQAQPLIDDAELLALFESLCEDDAGSVAGARDDRRASFRSALTLILLRRRLIRQVGVEERSGVETLLVKLRGASADDAPIAVERPNLNAAGSAELVEELGALVRGAT